MYSVFGQLDERWLVPQRLSPPSLELPESIQRYAPELWDSVRPLYDAGRYAEAADRGRDLIEASPSDGKLYYNVACCESPAGRTHDAIKHLRQAIAIWVEVGVLPSPS